MNGLTQYYSVQELSPSAAIDMIKLSYRQLAKNFRPDTFTGIKDELQRVMRDLNEAVRILSKAHARPFLEPKSLIPFHNFDDS